MDPFSAEGELVNIHNAFHQGQYQFVVDFDTTALSPENQMPARVLQLRSRIALGEASQVAKALASESSPVDLVAVHTFAQHVADPSSDAPKQKAQQLAKSDADNLTVQLMAGTVLANAGEMEEAVQLLSKHQGSLDAVAIITQIHLQSNRLDLAQAEVRKARSWAQDNLLVNLAESWVGLREGGEKYQAAFYVYEELATAPSTSSAQSLLGQAVSETHLGRYPEAEAAMDTALERAPEDADVLANAVVLNTILGKQTAKEEMLKRLEKVDKTHPLLQGLEAKKESFAAALGKYEPKFEVQA